MKLEEVIKKPLITEKSTQETMMGKYAFLVDRRANKSEVAQAVEKFFGVKVLKVWTAKFRKGGKKATVQLAEGEKLDLFTAPAEEGK